MIKNKDALRRRVKSLLGHKSLLLPDDVFHEFLLLFFEVGPTEGEQADVIRNVAKAVFDQNSTFERLEREVFENVDGKLTSLNKVLYLRQINIEGVLDAINRITDDIKIPD